MDNIMNEINNIKNWKKTRKKSYEVYVCRPLIGCMVYNRLENVRYTTDTKKQFVISGTVGEQWVIDANKLAKTYCTLDNQPITAEYLKKKVVDNGQIDWIKLKTITGADSQLNWAFHLPLSVKNFPVQTSWGDTLYANAPGRDHGQGDFLVCSDAGGYPNLNDVWVVNGLVFSYTYDMRAFPNLAVNTNNTTPIPATLVRKQNTSWVKPYSTQAVSVDYTKPIVVARLMTGPNVVGYEVQMPDKSKKSIKKDALKEAAIQGKIGNVTTGPADSLVLFGKDWSELPVMQLDKNRAGNRNEQDNKEYIVTVVRDIKVALLGNPEANVDTSKPLVVGCIKDSKNNIVGVTIEFRGQRRDYSLLGLIGKMSNNQSRFEVGNLSFKSDTLVAGNTGQSARNRFLLRGSTWGNLECKQIGA